MTVGEELARRGHQVTVVSPHPYKTVPPGVTDIVIESEFDRATAKLTEELLVSPNVGLPWNSMALMSIDSNRNAYMTPEVQAIINNKNIDVLITLPVFGNEASYYVAHKTNASLAVFVTAPYGFPHINWAMGDTANPAFIQSPVTGFPQHMDFVQRLINTGAQTMFMMFRNFYILPRTQTMLKELFPGQEIPNLASYLHDNAALFINHGTPFTGDGLRPVHPNTIMAGLMSCVPAKPLPEHLEQFISESQHGVIFVSFGSVVKASKMPEHKRKAMLSVFSKLPQRIIWKWETEMTDAPDNVMTSSWLPQTSLLAHNNVKLFITHGGAGSIQETICYKTPIVGVPIFGDQVVNVKDAVNNKLGLQQDWHTMTEESLTSSIEQVIRSPVYQSSVDHLSELIMDQPQHPLERSVWWLEYLLRHPHNTDMRPHTHHLNWAQYFLLDVLAVILTVLLVFIIIIVKIARLCCCRRKQKQE